ncbi:hypothetical protein [Streptomyces sp. NPDC058735]|uniref:hypothetical protein n=1 Tax=unclassified Streptomyces TaxID=2593676 RepID=UPI00367AEEC7
MGNVFRAGEQSPHPSNGATEVFVGVLTPAASGPADEEWDYRFAALLTSQDQNTTGRGVVGFDPRDIARGPRHGSAPGRRTWSCGPPTSR